VNIFLSKNDKIKIPSEGKSIKAALSTDIRITIVYIVRSMSNMSSKFVKNSCKL
jgi:hypothetical protein